jgi:hypothetical protein
MLLAHGKIVYFNEARLAVDYFSQLDPKLTCPSWNNPADFFMDILSLDSIESDFVEGGLLPKTKEQILEEYRERIEFLEGAYQRSPLRNDYAHVSTEGIHALDEGQFA